MRHPLLVSFKSQLGSDSRGTGSRPKRGISGITGGVLSGQAGSPPTTEADMSRLYGETHRAFQDQHDTRRLADRLENLAHSEFDDGDRAFIESVPFFFLSTVDERGRPTVSYKGGAPGFVQISGPGEIVFPVYDGNGMFLSLGNIASNEQVGLLFISFESPPRRLRVQGTARIAANDGPHASPGAINLVYITAGEIFVNCGRYIHNLEQQRLSPHVPD